MMNVIFAVLVLGVIAVVFGLILSVAATAERRSRFIQRFLKVPNRSAARRGRSGRR